MSSDAFGGTIVESVQNAEFTKNVKLISSVYNDIDSYIQNLHNDC